MEGMDAGQPSGRRTRALPLSRSRAKTAGRLAIRRIFQRAARLDASTSAGLGRASPTRASSTSARFVLPSLLCAWPRTLLVPLLRLRTFAATPEGRLTGFTCLRRPQQWTRALPSAYLCLSPSRARELTKRRLWPARSCPDLSLNAQSGLAPAAKATSIRSRVSTRSAASVSRSRSSRRLATASAAMPGPAGTTSTTASRRCDRSTIRARPSQPRRLRRPNLAVRHQARPMQRRLAAWPAARRSNPPFSSARPSSRPSSSRVRPQRRWHPAPASPTGRWTLELRQFVSL